MKMKKAQVGGIIVAIVVIFVIAAGAYYIFLRNNPNPATGVCVNTANKTYLTNDSSCAITFLCVQGMQGFKDSCGCGCEIIPAGTTSNPPTETPSPQTHNVEIMNFAFSPSTLNVNMGDTVIWTNRDSTAHTVTSDSGSELGSGVLQTGQTYSHTFTTAGTFNYHCSIHTTMHGQIILGSGSSGSTGSTSSGSGSSSGY